MIQMSPLSKREQEVVTLLLQSKTNKLIALSLGISDRTVEFHLKNIYTKFHVSSRIELVLKLGKTTGAANFEKLGDSTVDIMVKNIKNRDERNLQVNWLVSFRNIISTNKELEMKRQDIITIVVGCIFFGVAMATRDVLSDIWIRAIVAGIAFVALGLTIYRFSNKKKSQKII